MNTATETREIFVQVVGEGLKSFGFVTHNIAPEVAALPREPRRHALLADAALVAAVRGQIARLLNLPKDETVAIVHLNLQGKNGIFASYTRSSVKAAKRVEDNLAGRPNPANKARATKRAAAVKAETPAPTPAPTTLEGQIAALQAKLAADIAALQAQADALKAAKAAEEAAKVKAAAKKVVTPKAERKVVKTSTLTTTRTLTSAQKRLVTGLCNANSSLTERQAIALVVGR